jgi:DDE family transposase
LVDLISGLIPAGVQGGLLGDGACDGTRLQHTLQPAGWSYACRTATRTVAPWEGEPFRLDALGACLKPGRLIECKEVHVTREAYGPILLLCCWAKGYQEPLYVVSNMATAEEACRWYEKRFRIETFVSDQKSRGFHMHKSHISDAQRLSRLFIAACLAYIGVVYLGSVWEKDQWRPIIHRRKRCDLRLFQLGFRLLEYFLNEDMPIPVQFHVTI